MVSLWAVSAFNGVSSVPAVTEIAPQWADQLQGPQGLIWHFGAETDLLNYSVGQGQNLARPEIKKCFKRTENPTETLARQPKFFDTVPT